MALNRVTSAADRVKIQNIIVSVSDKTGLDTFIPAIIELNPEVQIFSTGGTLAKIKGILGEKRAAANLSSVADFTGQPEMQGGLVKTLDFKIYLGLLSETGNQSHISDLKRTNGMEFDMVVVNLYPFAQTIRETGVTLEDARTNIDIGGPCMLRAASKNFLRVASVCEPVDYPSILDEMKDNDGSLSLSTRFELSLKSFRHTAEYDTAISEYMALQAAKSIPQLYSHDR